MTGRQSRSLHRRGVRQARSVPGVARAGPRLRGGRRAPAAQRRQVDEFQRRITVVAEATDDRDVTANAVAGYDEVLTVLVPRGVDHALPGPRLVLSCGRHITRDGLDVYS
jgi:hypothetical protein